MLATYGCSLSAAVAIMNERGYGLFGVDGQDAVFFDKVYENLTGSTGVDEFLCYRQVYASTSVPFSWIQEWASESTKEVLTRVWCNITIHDKLTGVAHIPFSLSL